MLWYMTVMFYNVSLAKTYGIEDLHDTVLSGKWTLEKMETVIKDAYRDTNANGVKDVGDNFGLYCPNTTPSCSAAAYVLSTMTTRICPSSQTTTAAKRR